jgi:SNF2 family DNA or RNA helicase
MKGKKKSSKKAPIIPYRQKPAELSLHEWQIALRKQFVEKTPFSVQKTGSAPVWTDYLVQNPRNNSSYTVALRSLDIGTNYCSCGDFRTNTLGTCKHIEAAAQFVKRKRGLKRYLKVPYEAPNSSIFLRYGIERHVCLRVGSEATAAFIRAANKYFDSDQKIKDIHWNRFPFILNKLKKLAPDIDLKPDAMKFIIEKRADADRTEKIKPLKRRWKSYFDSLLRIRPYPYQAKGVWYAVEKGRSLIADEMGLGKTIQAIAAAAVFNAEFNVKKTLIICPTSLKYQWKAEIEKFSHLSAHIIEGNPGVRRQAYRESDAFFLIISHHLVYYDIDHLLEFEPDLIILDEAQRIKNWSTKISRNIKRLQSQYAIVLTGTPLENKIEELYSILQFVNPHVLPPVFEFLYNHRILDENGKVIGYKDMHAIKAQLAPVMMRRRKAEVLSELPEKSDQNILLPVTEEQLELHEEFQNGVSRLVHKWRRFGFLSEGDRLRLMILLGQMRMVADSTYLIDQQARHDTKINVIKDLLEEILEEENNKVVVFSEWLKMHSLIEQQLE